MTTKQELVQAKISAITSVFSDYGNAVYRDTQNYNALLATQSEFSDEEITLVARQTLGMQFRVRGLCHTDNIKQTKEHKVNELEIEIDINEVEDININALTPKQKALRLNALVKLASGNVFTNHDFEEALTLTRQLMKRQGDYD